MQLGKKSGTSDEQRNVDNSAKTLLANIRFMSVDKPIRTIVITSTIPNEGKTFVSAQLGRAMATSGKRTLLVECDMRRRSMASTLNIHAAYGLYSVMTGEVSLEDAAVPTGVQRLHFLDAEPHIPNPSDLLNARSFNRLMEMMKKSFDYIIFDTPPVGTFVDAAVLGAKVDAVFMVIREHYTRKDEIQRAADQLRTAKVPLHGVIMNYCERQSSEYYYEYYYKEGNRKRRHRTERYESMESYDTSYDDMRARPSYTGSQNPFDYIQPDEGDEVDEMDDWGNAPDLDYYESRHSASAPDYTDAVTYEAPNPEPSVGSRFTPSVSEPISHAPSGDVPSIAVNDEASLTRVVFKPGSDRQF